MASFVGASLRNHPSPWLIGLVALFYFWHLGQVELSVTDEARSGMIVRDMLEGHYLLPRTPDGYLVEKPPAYYGACALLGSLFGVNEWTLRGVSVLAALGTLAVTAWIVRYFGTPRAAGLAVSALASNILFLTAAREALVDMMLTLFLSVGFAGYIAGRLGRISPERATGICGLAFGLAMLSKGPLGLVLPIAVCGGDALIELRGRFWVVRRPWAPILGVILLAVAVAALWYGPGLLVGKKEFLETSILSENFRMPTGHATGIGVPHRKPWYYYAEWQGMTVLPFLPLLVAVPSWLRDPANRSARLLLGSWILFGGAFFQAAVNKRFYYLLPLQPAVAAVLGLAADSWMERPGSRRWSFLATGVAVALGGIACAILPFLRVPLAGPRGPEIVAAIARHRDWVIGFGIAAALAGVGMAAAVRRGVPALRASAITLALLVVAARVGLGDRLLGDFDRTRPFVREMTAKIPDTARPAIYPPIVGYSLDFYWPKPVPRDAAAALDADYVLIGQAHQQDLPWAWEEVGSWRYGDADRTVKLVHRLP
ncbi:MAG TPA: phospholipid carrier-dependent glycosyltransferase [Planctomycetota bacterium]|nr:phospholipid carrier-dependent glycosyltransferase [Planctomycetota bacterium]